ncbi:hypothetical protein AAKU67_003129 [Oxalobacteraceae bacterium GrIS 2.11]
MKYECQVNAPFRAFIRKSVTSQWQINNEFLRQAPQLQLVAALIFSMQHFAPNKSLFAKAEVDSASIIALSFLANQ